MERREGPDGEALFVDDSDGERGSIAPFFVVYRDPDRKRRWGYICSNCDSFDTAMDAMGRIQCNACQNVKQPDAGDAAHA
jgi:hypothetical protein